MKDSMGHSKDLLRDKGRKQTGGLGESLACLLLERKGYDVLERNYRKQWGEIDIIAVKGRIVHFVEVKTVSVGDLSREIDYRPEELIGMRKLEKLARTASLYMEEKRDNREYQLDAIGILLDRSTKTARCRHFEQILEGNL